jgi:aerobic-type carbon monoxide dehydrogenase small subunit (CoxS/CutS family)
MAEEPQRITENLGKISRREFLKDASLVVGGATIGSMTVLGGCKEASTKTITSTLNNTVTKTTTITVSNNPNATTITVPPSEAATTPLTLTVNGHVYDNLQIQPEWTLQYLLHDILGWTDVKDMCTGYGACGSCAVILEGRPVLSCMALVAECDGMNVQTAQGIAREDHPIIESYTKYLTFQCGYCTPGFVVTAKALLDKKPNPTQKEIIEALDGNLCRCGTYPQHILAVQDAANSMAGGV